MTTGDFDAKAVVEICRANLEAREFSEVFVAALNYPEALTRAIGVHAGEELSHRDFAHMMLRAARDVNQRRGVAS